MAALPHPSETCRAVGTKPKTPNTFSGNESFAYLLTELELLVESGTIRWSAATAGVAERRLEELAATMRRVAAQARE